MTASTADYYGILGLTSDATLAEVKNAYARACAVSAAVPMPPAPGARQRTARQEPGTSAVGVGGLVPGAAGLVDPAFFRVVEFAGVA
jgi:hypothetical protein